MKAGWELRTIGDFCEVIAGKSPESKFYNGDSKGMPFYQGKKDFGDKFINLPNTWTTEITKTARKNDILMSIRAPVGPVNFATQDICIGRGLAAIRSKGLLNVDFLFYQLLYLQPRISGKEGAVFASINKSEISGLPIAYTNLSEQQRIVAILDEAFAAIAAARANAEQNRQNARALFDTFLNAVYLGGDADAWPLRRLGDVFDIGSSKRIHERDWSPSGVPFYGGKEIVKLAKFGHAVSNAYISEQMYQDFASKYDMPKAGDILITARGTIGVGYVVKRSDKFYYKDGNIISMRAKEAANPHYLLYAFRSNALADQLGVLSGTTVTHLPLEKAKKLLLRMPEIGIQDAIVKRIMKFEAKTQRLESLYQRKIEALDELKQSLLQQAFSGNL